MGSSLDRKNPGRSDARHFNLYHFPETTSVFRPVDVSTIFVFAGTYILQNGSAGPGVLEGIPDLFQPSLATTENQKSHTP